MIIHGSPIDHLDNVQKLCAWLPHVLSGVLVSIPKVIWKSIICKTKWIVKLKNEHFRLFEFNGCLKASGDTGTICDVYRENGIDEST